MGVSRALLSGLAVQRAPLGDRGAAGAFSTGALRVSARAPRPGVSAGDPMPGIGPPVRLPGQAPRSGSAWFGLRLVRAHRVRARASGRPDPVPGCATAAAAAKAPRPVSRAKHPARPASPDRRAPDRRAPDSWAPDSWAPDRWAQAGARTGARTGRRNAVAPRPHAGSAPGPPVRPGSGLAEG